MKKYFTLLMVAVAFGATAQIKNVELKVATNTSFINSASKNLQIRSVPINPSTGYTSTTTNIGGLKESYDNQIGMEAGVGFQVWESGRFFIRTGLNIQYLRYHRKVEVEEIESLNILPGTIITPGVPTGYPIGSIYYTSWFQDRDGIFAPIPRFPSTVFDPNPNLGKTTALYVEIPVSVGRTFLSDKMSVSVGMQVQLLAHSTVVKEEYRSGRMEEYKDKTGDGFSNAMFGVIAETSYRILKPVEVSIRYNRSLTPIYDEGARVGGKTYFNTLSLGLAYQL